MPPTGGDLEFALSQANSEPAIPSKWWNSHGLQTQTPCVIWKRSGSSPCAKPQVAIQTSAGAAAFAARLRARSGADDYRQDAASKQFAGDGHAYGWLAG